jgi:hypothetical protein
MFSKTSILSLAAIASIGAAALVTATSSADARPGGFRGGHKGGFHGRFAHRPHFHHHRHWHVKHRPWIYGVGAAAVAAPAYGAVAGQPPAGPCARLAMEYARENPMAFMARCSKEMAAGPMGGMPPMGAMPPQQSEPPQQPGDTEPMPTK